MSSIGAPRHAVATELLDRAIELFLRGDSYYAAIHLGGAAEEVLAVYAREVSLTPTERMASAFDQEKAAVVALKQPTSPAQAEQSAKQAGDRMNYAKNSVKHKRGDADVVVDFDAPEEAVDVIDRAISTYMQVQVCLKLPLLQSIAQFDAARK